MSSPAKILAFINQKGGVGKTTMSFNLAHALAGRGHKVLCIDMDPQANLTLLFNRELYQKFNIHHLLLNTVRELKSLHSPVMTGEVLEHHFNIDLLPAGQELSGFELSVAGITSPRQLILKKFIECNRLQEIYDYIVIDCPPTLGLLVVNVLCAANGLLVPFKPDDFSRKGLSHLREVLEQVEDMGISQKPQIISYIPNLVDGRRKQDQSDLKQMIDEIPERSAGPVIYNKAHMGKALAQKKSVFDYQGKEFQDLRQGFNGLADQIEEWTHEH